VGYHLWREDGSVFTTYNIFQFYIGLHEYMYSIYTRLLSVQAQCSRSYPIFISLWSELNSVILLCSLSVSKECLLITRIHGNVFRWFPKTHHHGNVFVNAFPSNGSTYHSIYSSYNHRDNLISREMCIQPEYFVKTYVILYIVSHQASSLCSICRPLFPLHCVPIIECTMEILSEIFSSNFTLFRRSEGRA
jgi:hypothetical protein